MDNAIVQLLLKVLGMSLCAMLVIMLCCIATPRLAKWIDSLRERPTKGGADDTADTDDVPTVRGIYDASSDKDYDLNYKIYNKDIYGVDFKNGKKGKESGQGDNLDE